MIKLLQVILKKTLVLPILLHLKQRKMSLMKIKKLWNIVRVRFHFFHNLFNFIKNTASLNKQKFLNNSTKKLKMMDKIFKLSFNFIKKILKNCQKKENHQKKLKKWKILTILKENFLKKKTIKNKINFNIKKISHFIIQRLNQIKKQENYT